MRESQLQRDILLAFGSRPDLRLWRNNTGYAPELKVRFGLPGSADILGILQGGRFLAIEVKSDDGRLSAKQQAFRAMIERFGGLYILARSVEDVARAIDQR